MYNQSFYLTGNRGNNTFSYREGRRLYVPAVIDGGLEDVQIGDEVVFEDEDEGGEMRSCVGLKSFVRMDLGGVPTMVVDNHNHAFYFWWEALEKGLIEKGAVLVHVDQHKDMREPAEKFDGDVFRYTNEVLNVGNYLPPAMESGLIGDVQFVTGEADLEDMSFLGRGNKILNLDLDFFAPEMGYIDFEKAKRFVLVHAREADFITIATSPFFIDQERAIDVLRELF